MVERHYALENLFVDQDPDLVADTIPSLLTWLSPKRNEGPHFLVRLDSRPEERLVIAWSLPA